MNPTGRKFLWCTVALASAVSYCLARAAGAAGLPQQSSIIPVGWDSFLQWDQWAKQRDGVRAYMRSTYDRNGGNSDMGNFLFMDGQRNVTLDVIGKGTLYFFRTNFWHGSPWHFVVDGRDLVVKEQATDDPLNARKTLKSTNFIPSGPFPQPLAFTWTTTKGADLNWSPISFQRSLQLAYERTSFGTGYYIYHLYRDESRLSRAIGSWDATTPANVSVVALLSRAGTDIAPTGINKIVGKTRKPDSKSELPYITAVSPSVIRALKFSLPLAHAMDLERVRLSVTWDGRSEPSINAPLCLFFGAGTLYNRDEREFLVKGFPVTVRFDYAAGKVELACYFPMPFRSTARIELSGPELQTSEIEYEVRYESLSADFSDYGYFHATYSDHPEPTLGVDLTLLDTRGVEGESDWSRQFVGTSLIFSHNGDLNTLEGDPRFFFDDSQSPQAYGTGTEEWSGGGFYWGGQTMTLPFAGHPCGAPSPEMAKDPKDLIESSYRFLLSDLMPFGRRAVIRFEHGGENLSTEHYESVTYWYGSPKASLIKTDELDVGNSLSEAEHEYQSADGSSVELITSRYELGIDTFPEKPWSIPGSAHVYKPANYERWIGKEIYPAQVLDGRHTTRPVEFTISIAENNHGLLLRRSLDYQFPNQRAEVFVSDATVPEHLRHWQSAGVWYLAGANTWVNSAPRGELDDRVYNVRTSNRRFREDEFMISGSLTAGLKKLRIKIVPQAVPQDLYLGYSFPHETAWSELGYSIYSYLR